MICYKFVVYLFDMQLRGARPSTCYGSGVEQGLYQSDIIVYWYKRQKLKVYNDV